MKALIFVTCLTAIVAHEAVYEDDEVVTVEDVIEEEKPRYRSTEGEGQGGSNNNNYKRGSSGSSSAPKSTEEVLAATKKQLYRLAAKQRKWEEYEDDGVVAGLAAELDRGYTAFEYRHAGLVAQQAKEPGKNLELYELAVELKAEYTRLQGEIVAQVARHQALMWSSEQIINSRVIKNGKNLGKYIKGRLKAKTLAKKLSSKANIKEMLKVQALVRGSRMHGLGDTEMIDLMIWCTAPATVLLLLRIALIHYRIFDFPSLEVSASVDTTTAFAPTSVGLGLTLWRAGVQFLTPVQIVVLFCITTCFAVVMLAATRAGLRAVRSSNQRRKKRKH